MSGTNVSSRVLNMKFMRAAVSKEQQLKEEVQQQQQLDKSHWSLAKAPVRKPQLSSVGYGAMKEFYEDLEDEEDKEVVGRQVFGAPEPVAVEEPAAEELTETKIVKDKKQRGKTKKLHKEEFDKTERTQKPNQALPSLEEFMGLSESTGSEKPVRVQEKGLKRGLEKSVGKKSSKKKRKKSSTGA